MNWRRAIIIASICVSSLLLLRHAWVSEDAYITFRYVDSALRGQGLVFNAGERVQAYTHPLWLLLLLPGGLLRIDPFYWVIGLGLVFNGLTVGLLARHLRGARSPYFAFLVVLAALFACSSFIDFQTSGLENSLTHFLLLLLVLSAAGKRDGRLLRSSLSTGFLLLNRLDMFFISMPILAYVFVKEKTPVRTRTRSLLLGLLPVIAWEIFSIIYYGFVFPNPKYTKLGSLPLGKAITQGLVFLSDFLQWEPLPAFMLAFFVVLLLSRGGKIHRAAAAGVLIYLAYVIMIGGGFMRGRFLLPALFLAAVTSATLIARWEIARYGKAILVGLLVAAAVLSYLRAESATAGILASGIANERKYYGPANTLLGRLKGEKTHKLAAEGLRLSHESRRHRIALSHRAIGILGYYAGPRVTVVDELGLADAFIARTPDLPPEKQRIGHPEHRIPAEYLRERLDGVVTDRWADPEMLTLWRRIKTITQGPILSAARFSAILSVWRDHGI